MSYRLPFAAALLLLSGGILLGIYHSFESRRELPVLSLTDVVERHFEETNELLRAGEFGAALERAQLASRLLSSDRHVTYDMIGRAWIGMDELDRAADAFREALRIEPDHASAHNHLGIIYAAQGRYDEASAAWNTALRLDPQLEAARTNLAKIRNRDAATGATAADGEPTTDLDRARAYVSLFYRGELETLRRSFDATFAGQMSAEGLDQLRRQVQLQLGPELELLDERIVRVRETDLYVRRARFERHAGEVELLISLTDSRAINGIVLQPVAEGVTSVKPTP